jgi:hypothetical protein
MQEASDYERDTAEMPGETEESRARQWRESTFLVVAARDRSQGEQRFLPFARFASRHEEFAR